MNTLLTGLSDRANRVTELVLVPVVAFFAVVLAVSVFSRYVFQLPIVTSIELTRIAFVWACFLGAAAGVKRRAHVRVVALATMMPAWYQRLIPAIVHGAFLVLAALMVWYGSGLAARMFATTFPTLGISQGWLYLALPVAGALMFLHAAAALLAWEPVDPAPDQLGEGLQ